MTQLSQEYFDEKVVEIHTRFDKTDKRFDAIDRRLDEHDAKLDAILEAVATRRELQNLVRELKAQGIKLDESRIFAD